PRARALRSPRGPLAIPHAPQPPSHFVPFLFARSRDPRDLPSFPTRRSSDLVVFHHGAPVELSPARARPLLARLRAGQAALVTIDARLPGTSLHMDANVVGYHGIGRGSGRIRGVDIAVRTEAKGMRPKTTTII